MYESGTLRRVTGGPLHPGGWKLTERMFSLCDPIAGDRVLDVGCGDGSTTRRLSESFPIFVFGLDRSEILLRQGLEQVPVIPVACATGIALPIASEQLDIILAECSLSSISDIDKFLVESWRVLRPGGRLIISDVYVRNPAGASLLRALPLTCGLRNAFEQGALLRCVEGHGFEIHVWEDHSEALKDLTGQIASSTGSTSAFWNQSEPEIDPIDIVLAASRAKLGYFGLIAQKYA